MLRKYQILAPNHYLSTQVGLVREWQSRDTVAFAQLVDLTEVNYERERCAHEGCVKPSYTAFVVDAIAYSLARHSKLNRIVYRSLTGYRWVQLENIDIAVAVEAVDDGVDIAYASIIRNANQIGRGAIMEALRTLARVPLDDPQFRRIRRLPPIIAALLARATGKHPRTWTEFRGGSCALTSPAKYGVESVIVKSAWPLQFAFGHVKPRAMVIDGECVPRTSAMLSLSWHRDLTTGAVAARFFEDVVQFLQRLPSQNGDP